MEERQTNKEMEIGEEKTISWDGTNSAPRNKGKQWGKGKPKACWRLVLGSTGKFGTKTDFWYSTLFWRNEINVEQIQF